MSLIPKAILQQITDEVTDSVVKAFDSGRIKINVKISFGVDDDDS